MSHQKIVTVRSVAKKGPQNREKRHGTNGTHTKIENKSKILQLLRTHTHTPGDFRFSAHYWELSSFYYHEQQRKKNVASIHPVKFQKGLEIPKNWAAVTGVAHAEMASKSKRKRKRVRSQNSVPNAVIPSFPLPCALCFDRPSPLPLPVSPGLVRTPHVRRGGGAYRKINIYLSRRCAAARTP